MKVFDTVPATRVLARSLRRSVFGDPVMSGLSTSCDNSVGRTEINHFGWNCDRVNWTIPVTHPHSGGLGSHITYLLSDDADSFCETVIMVVVGR